MICHMGSMNMCTIFSKAIGLHVNLNETWLELGQSFNRPGVTLVLITVFIFLRSMELYIYIYYFL